LPEDLAGRRFKSRDRVRRPHDQLLDAASADDDGRAVGRPIRQFAPAQLAAHPIQSNDARVRLPAGTDDEQLANTSGAALAP
jgi:hypothetical protein